MSNSSKSWGLTSQNIEIYSFKLRKHIQGENGTVLSCFLSTPVLMTLLSVLAFNFVPFHQNTFWSEFCHLPKVSGKQKKITSWLTTKKLFCEKNLKLLNVVLKVHFSYIPDLKWNYAANLVNVEWGKMLFFSRVGYKGYFLVFL